MREMKTVRVFLKGLVIMLAVVVTIVFLLPVSVQADGLTATQIESPDLFSLSVVQQSDPEGMDVTTQAGQVSQYIYATRNNTLGFFAHSYLAGGAFYKLEIGSPIIVTFADGSQQTFIVRNIQIWGRSGLIFTRGGKNYTVAEYFAAVYTGEYHLALQTCYGDGVMVVLAYPGLRLAEHLKKAEQ